MHSHLPPLCEPAPRPAGIGRRLTRRAEAITAPFWQARQRHGRHWRARPWASPRPDLLNPGRVPEESYRDYVFRKGI